MIVFWVAAAGAAGAAVRYTVDALLHAAFAARYPVATSVINISGSLLLGVLTGLTATGAETPVWRMVLGIGFCGGYTTFSTAAVEIARLMYRKQAWPGIGMWVGVTAVTVIAAGVGVGIGAAL